MRLLWCWVLMTASWTACYGTDTFPGDDNDDAWTTFKQMFDRDYSTGQEERARRLIFLSNLALIKNANANGNNTLFGVTPFADISPAEFQMKFTRRRPIRSWPACLGVHHWDSNEIMLPDRVDWQEEGATTKVQDENQNGCFGACWAFSAAGAIEGAVQIKYGRLQALSEQQFMDCSGPFGNNGCDGGDMQAAFNYAAQAPLCANRTYPYHGPVGKCKVNTSACVPVSLARVRGCKSVLNDTKSLMAAVAHHGPVSVAVHGAWGDKNAFQFYKGGILKVSCGSPVDHGVLVVGYGSDAADTAYWKIKNSYGTQWGMRGYALLERGKNITGGECGVLLDASFPVLA